MYLPTRKQKIQNDRRADTSSPRNTHYGRNSRKVFPTQISHNSLILRFVSSAQLYNTRVFVSFTLKVARAREQQMRQIRTELLDQENDKSRGYVQIDTDWRFPLAIVASFSHCYTNANCIAKKKESKLIALKLFNTKTHIVPKQKY